MQRFLRQVPTSEVISAVIFWAFFAFFQLFAEKFPFLISCCFYEIYAAKPLKRFRRSENLPGSVKTSGFLCIIFFRAAARNFQSGIIGYN